MDWRVAFPIRELRNDPRDHGEDADANAEGDGDLVWLQALSRRRSGALRGVHNVITLVGSTRSAFVGDQVSL